MRYIVFFITIMLLFPAIASAQDITPDGAYRLSVGDEVRITVYEENSLDSMTEVLSDGSLSFPLIGRIVVEGWTLSQVEDECRARLAGYLLNPVVTVIVTAPHIPVVKVFGKVRDAGSYNIKPGDTLLDAIASAGGFIGRCDIKRILVLNRNGSRFVNLKKYLRGEETDMDVDIAIHDNDLIFVPEVSRVDWGRASEYFSGIIQSLLVAVTR